VGIVLPYTAFTVVQEMKHEHHDRVDFGHMKRRTKSFPWTASDCDLFDLHCKHAAKAGH